MVEAEANDVANGAEEENLDDLGRQFWDRSKATLNSSGGRGRSQLWAPVTSHMATWAPWAAMARL